MTPAEIKTSCTSNRSGICRSRKYGDEIEQVGDAAGHARYGDSAGRRGRSIHGYALAQRIRLISRDLLQIQQGSLYPALHRLENRGFLAAEWNESETGRDAKFYRLTPRGRAQLRKETAAWARLSEAIALILRRAEGGAQ